MITQNTIENVEEMIRTNKPLNENNKTQLLNLLATLKPEIAKLSNDQAEHAESVAGFIERSTHEALRQDKNPTLLKLAIDGLSASVKGFEASHSQLVENVNNIASALANIGI
jgi:ABC-type transporter Mla subunit MlaD